MTWPRRLAWAASLTIGAAVVGSAWLVLRSPGVTAGIVLTILVVMGGVPCAAALWASGRQPDNWLAPALALLPGLLVALVLSPRGRAR